MGREAGGLAPSKPDDWIAVVLPPGERFSPTASGAVGLLAHRIARQPGRFKSVISGAATANPFQDVPFRAVRTPWGLGSVASRYAGAVARSFRQERPALVEVHNRPDVALSLARRLAPLPVLLVLHNDPQGMRSARTPAARTRLLQRLAGVLTVSQYLRERLLEGVAGEKAVVLPNCIDLAALPPSPPLREQVILFAGRVVADKGADAFVAACARALPRLPGWRAEMIGADRFGADSPETPFLRALRPRAEAAGILLSGYCPHDAVLAAMAGAAIMVVPSRWAEPFGLTALEAMASGAALLCSGRGGLAEVVGDVAVRIDPDDVAGMAECLVQLALDPARRAALGLAGLARAKLFDVREARAALDGLRGAILHLASDASI